MTQKLAWKVILKCFGVNSFQECPFWKTTIVYVYIWFFKNVTFLFTTGLKILFCEHDVYA